MIATPSPFVLSEVEAPILWYAALRLRSGQTELGQAA